MPCYEVQEKLLLHFVTWHSGQMPLGTQPEIGEKRKELEPSYAILGPAWIILGPSWGYLEGKEAGGKPNFIPGGCMG